MNKYNISFNWGVSEGPKYTSGGVGNFLVSNFIKQVIDLCASHSLHQVHEIGCGEGHLALNLARNGFIVSASDASSEAIAVASNMAKELDLDVSIFKEDIYNLKSVKKYKNVLCCEVLEHLTDPSIALRNILSSTDGKCILSVPREPTWQLLNLLRGKYWEGLGNTPGHYNHWSSSSFIEFVSAHAKILEIRKPLPWTIVVCEPFD